MTDHEWDENIFPLAYFITFRTHGTWLHGDQRKSVERHGRNLYNSPRIPPDPMFSELMNRNMTTEPVVLDSKMRGIVDLAIRNVCDHRNYLLSALHVRTNHAHVVSSAACHPKTVMNAFKANATRELREAGLVGDGQKVWSRGGSTRYLWRQESVDRAIHYTLYGQGDDLPDF